MTLVAECQTRVTGERQTLAIDLAVIAMRQELTPTRTPMASEWLTEPSAPLDLAHRVLLATVDGEHVYLNGRKQWISNAPVCDVMNVTCRMADGKGASDELRLPLGRSTHG